MSLDKVLHNLIILIKFYVLNVLLDIDQWLKIPIRKLFPSFVSLLNGNLSNASISNLSCHPIELIFCLVCIDNDDFLGIIFISSHFSTDRLFEFRVFLNCKLGYLCYGLGVGFSVDRELANELGLLRHESGLWYFFEGQFLEDEGLQIYF